MFPGPWWHAGADEYLGVVSTPADYYRFPQLEAYADKKYGARANGKDAVLDFTNSSPGSSTPRARRCACGPTARAAAAQ